MGPRLEGDNKRNVARARLHTSLFDHLFFPAHRRRALLFPLHPIAILLHGTTFGFCAVYLSLRCLYIVIV